MDLARRQALIGAAGASLAASLPLRAQEAPQRGGTLTVQLTSEQRVLNPAIRASTGVYVMASKIVEPLVDLDANGEPVGVLAESWEAAPDGLTIRFNLRRGVTWHDGRPFTSKDVQFSAMECWKRILNYGTTLNLYLEAVETPDAATAVFRFSRPMPLPLMLRALPDLGHVIPAHVFEGTNIEANPANTAPIGTGPFRFVQYERGQFVIVERNPSYWRNGFPHLDRIVWRFINDRAAATAAIESGQVIFSPYSGLALSDIARLSRDQRFTVSTRGNEGNTAHTVMEMNLRRRELSDVRVRRALCHALDLGFFVENFLYGYAKLGTGPIPSSSAAFYVPRQPPYAFDRARAERLLDEAGFRRPSRGANRFAEPLKILPAPWGEYTVNFATFIQQSLREIGVRVEIEQRDAPGFLTGVYRDHAFDLTTGWHQYRSDPAVSTTVWFRTGSPRGAPWTNQYGYDSPEMDRTIDAAASELDPAKRKALYQDFVRLAVEEVPVHMAVEHAFISVYSQKLRNSHNTPRWASSSWYDTWVTA
jgi:peptide/nickel transport system substrate-binding protein